MQPTNDSKVLASRKRLRAGRYSYYAVHRYYVIHDTGRNWLCTEYFPHDKNRSDDVVFESTSLARCEDYLASTFDCTYNSVLVSKAKPSEIATELGLTRLYTMLHALQSAYNEASNLELVSFQQRIIYLQIDVLATITAIKYKQSQQHLQP